MGPEKGGDKEYGWVWRRVGMGPDKGLGCVRRKDWSGSGEMVGMGRVGMGPENRVVMGQEKGLGFDQRKGWYVSGERVGNGICPEKGLG